MRGCAFTIGRIGEAEPEDATSVGGGTVARDTGVMLASSTGSTGGWRLTELVVRQNLLAVQDVNQRGPLIVCSAANNLSHLIFAEQPLGCQQISSRNFGSRLLRKQT